MVYLKKSIAIAVTSFYVSVGIVGPELAIGQVHSALTGITTTPDALTSDPLPFATPYRPEAEAPQDFVLETPAGIADASSEPNVDVNHEPNIDANPEPKIYANAVSAALSDNVVQHAPTVIIRPSVNGSQQFNDLTVEVNKLEDRPGNEFGIKVTVPDSVKIIELVPVQDENQQRNFKIRMEQNPEPGVIDSIADDTSPVDASQRVPVRIASNPINSSRQTNDAENTGPIGYQSNPFFGQQGFIPAAEPIVRVGTQLPHAIPSTGWPNKTQLPRTPSKLANYRKPAANSNIEPSPKPLRGSIQGPQLMGLGDIADFEVYVANPGATTANDVVVQLDVPPGMDVVVLDRAATIDQSRGTLSWQLPNAKPGEEQILRYRIKSLAEGVQQQRLRVSSGHGLISTEFGTNVQLDYGSSEAPLLPFESY